MRPVSDSHHPRLGPAHWQALMDNMGFAANQKTYNRLIAAYTEKHRAYHTLEHISACMLHLDNTSNLAERKEEIELALWFHDAIYKPFSSTNEDDSAEWARDFLTENNAAADVTDRVFDLIIFTKDHSAPEGGDGKLMLDIDLSILGAPDHVYAQFEKDVRREYRRVPSFVFKSKRREILKSFTDRPRLYHSDYFHDKFETRARVNLAAAIEALS